MVVVIRNMPIISNVAFELKTIQTDDGRVYAVPFTLSPSDVGEIWFTGCSEPAVYYDMVDRQLYVIAELNGKEVFLVVQLRIPRYKCGNKIQRVLPFGVIPNKRYTATVIEDKIVDWLKEEVTEKKEDKSERSKNQSKPCLEERAYHDTDIYSPCLESVMLWVIWFLNNAGCFQGHVLRQLKDIGMYSTDEKLQQLLLEIESSHILIYLSRQGKGWLAEAVRLVYHFGGKLLPYYGKTRSENLIRLLVHKEEAVVHSCVKVV